MKKAIMLGFGLFCMAVQGNVWDDCVARYAGRTDGEATGLFAKGGLLDVRHSANTSGATMANVQDWLALYGGRQILFRQESVQCATLGKTLENQTVLYFPHPAVTNTDESVVCKHSPLYFPLANFLQGDGITFLLRFRLDAEQFLKTDGAFDFVCPLICDYDWGAQQGWKIWIKASGSTDNEVYFCNGRRMNNYTAHTGLRITNDVWTARGEAWTELAVVIKDATHARIGLGQPGCVFKWADVVCDSMTTSLLPRENYNIYMGASSYTGDYAPSQEAARMSVHLLAAWNRALSDREVYEALGDPNLGVFRIGCAGRGGGHVHGRRHCGRHGRLWRTGRARRARCVAPGAFRFVFVHPRRIPCGACATFPRDASGGFPDGAGRDPSGRCFARDEDRLARPCTFDLRARGKAHGCGAHVRHQITFGGSEIRFLRAHRFSPVGHTRAEVE